MSRLLSVFLALILMGLSVATVSGHDATDNTTPKAADLVSVEVVLNSDVETASPGDALKFQVTVLRIADGHTFTGTVDGPDGDEDIASFTLDDDTPIKTMEVSYTIRQSDLGTDAVERTADLVWTFTLTDTATLGTALHTDGDNTETHTVTAGTNDTATGSVEVTLVKRPDADGGVLGIDLDLSGTTAPDTHAKGDKVTFKLVVTTGDTYQLRIAKTLVVMRQLYDADGEKVGKAIPSAVFTIPALQTGSRTDVLKSAPEYHALQTAEADEIADGGKLVFSYSVTINETDVLKDGKVVDLDKDGMVGQDNSDAAVTAAAVNADLDTVLATITTQDKVADLKDDDVLTLEMAPEPEATPSPYLFETEAAKVMELGGGTAIEITRLDTMAEITLTLGTLSSTGALLPRANGYIRDESRGQTYAVVRRDDGEVRRVWISSSSEWVPHIEWANVIAFYHVPSAVLNAIPLDGSMPEAEQLVDVAGDYYVYRDRAWRHIPNLSTFRAEGFRWCDLTTASADFFMREGVSSSATPLPSRVGPPAEGYPACGS